jgi:hypothetical protein
VPTARPAGLVLPEANITEAALPAIKAGRLMSPFGDAAATRSLPLKWRVGPFWSAGLRANDDDRVYEPYGFQIPLQFAVRRVSDLFLGYRPVLSGSRARAYQIVPGLCN